MGEISKNTLYENIIDVYDLLDEIVEILINENEPITCKPLYLSTKPSTYDDSVNHPSHYQSKNGMETIDVIRAFTTDMKGMEAVCSSNVIKYICRWKNKNGLEDLKKAKWYLNELINHVEKESK